MPVGLVVSGVYLHPPGTQLNSEIITKNFVVIKVLFDGLTFVT